MAQQKINNEDLKTIIENFPKDLFFLRNQFKRYEMHLKGSCDDKKLKIAFKYILLNEFVANVLANAGIHSETLHEHEECVVEEQIEVNESSD